MTAATRSPCPSHPAPRFCCLPLLLACAQVVVVARVLAGGKSVYVARYANCFRGSSDVNRHAEEIMLSDTELMRCLLGLMGGGSGRGGGGGGGGGGEGGGGKGDDGPELQLFMSFQPCHHSGGAVPLGEMARQAYADKGKEEVRGMPHLASRLSPPASCLSPLTSAPHLAAPRLASPHLAPQTRLPPLPAGAPRLVLVETSRLLL